MARTELPNGVILPAEYSDDWYEDMTSNLTKLDDVIGSDSEKLNSNDVAFLRMSSAALTDGGTGNFSDLNSSNKLKTGDYVLDSGRKLYQVVSVDSTNETFTVGNSLFKITAESDLAPVAESGDYDDLDNKPDLNPYDQHIVNTDIHVTTADKTKWNNQTYVFRYSSTAITDNSTIAFSTLDNTDNIKSGDKVIDSDGKIFSIVSVDTANQTVTVGSALIDLALDANVVHTSGNETVGGQKVFNDINAISSSAEIGVSGGNNSFKILDKNKKTISRYEGGTFSGGMAYSYWLVNNGSDVFNGLSLYQASANLAQLRPYSSTLSLQLGASNRYFSDCYTSKINNLTPSSLSLPATIGTVDISGYVTDLTGNTVNTYSPVVNGYIVITCNSTDVDYIKISNNLDFVSVVDNTNNQFTSGILGVWQPCVAGIGIQIRIKASALNSAKFIPCQGNI